MALSHRPKGECVTDHRPKIYYTHACPANSTGVWQINAMNRYIILGTVLTTCGVRTYTVK